MERYNFVNQRNYITPGYDISGREPFINLYFNNSGSVIIAGNVDNNYIYWLSVTKTEDLYVNEKIFNHIASGNILGVTHLYRALEQAGITFGQLNGYYQTSIVRAHGKMKWKTPFGHYYGSDNPEHHGMFFASSVKSLVDNLHKKCAVREADGYYERVLEGYLNTLENSADYDLKVKTTEEILKSEDYLILSENERISLLYRKCIERCGNLYNIYMTNSR